MAKERARAKGGEMVAFVNCLRGQSFHVTFHVEQVTLVIISLSAQATNRGGTINIAYWIP